MDNPGIKDLGTVDVSAINAATTAAVITSQPNEAGQTVAYLDRLAGMLAASISANFTYGASGGTSIKVLIETSIDQGTTWTEIARLAFTTASAQKVINLSGLTPKTTPATPATLTDDTCLDGFFGDRMRASIITVGTYVGNAALSVRMNAR